MRLLHAIHDYLPGHRSGSEIYAHALCGALARRGHEVEVLCAEYDAARPHGSTVQRQVDEVPVTELVNNWAFPDFAESYRARSLDRPLLDILRRSRPDVLHVHNLLNLSFELPRLARREGIAVVATLHDFTLFCPSGGQRVHVAERHICHELEPERCARCFRQSAFHRQMVAAPRQRTLWQNLRRWAGASAPGELPVRAAEISARLRAIGAVSDAVQLFVAPSRALAADAVRLGLPESKVEVSDYGFEPWPASVRERRHGPLRIGFVGTLTWYKGAHVLLEALRRLPADRYVARIHGILDWFPDYVRELRALAHGLPVEFCGGFGAGDATAVYGGMDVLVVPSLWPENSPLVIHEAFQAGIPVVGARNGGIPELVTDGVNGLIYTPEAADELAAALASLIADPDRLARLASAVPAVKSIDADAADWERRYRSVRKSS